MTTREVLVFVLRDVAFGRFREDHDTSAVDSEDVERDQKLVKEHLDKVLRKDTLQNSK